MRVQSASQRQCSRFHARTRAPTRSYVTTGRGETLLSCDTSTSHCAAAPGSSVFGDAKGALNTRNAGIGLMVGGVAAAVTGLIWYFVQPKTTVVGRLRMASYMTAVDGKNGGLLVSGAFGVRYRFGSRNDA